jgi:hypothetical protein
MKRKPWTPSRSSSTIASRRNSSPAAVLCLLLLCLPLTASAQAIEISVVPRGAFLAAALSFRWAHAGEVIDSLNKGLEARITFTTRLYERRRPAFSFAGDRLLAERTVSRSAFWDFLDKVFVVEEEGRRPRTFSDPDSLMRSFFALDELFGIDASAHRRLYVSARAQFEPVRLMPPLTLVGLAGAATSVATPWVQGEAP